VFTSDHGEGMGSHQMVRKNTPYDESARVPLIFSWPGEIPEGHVNKKSLVSGLDIMPTICEYVGIPTPKDVKGQSLKNIINEKSNKGADIIVTELQPNAQRMLRSQQHKFIHCKDDPVEMLFDMENDPGETQNLANDSQYAQVLVEHRRMLREWENKLDPAKEVPNADYWRNI
jgi:choline-sulfatase